MGEEDIKEKEGGEERFGGRGVFVVYRYGELGWGGDRGVFIGQCELKGNP